jgi:metal-dependent amidase/aminoacylase/carboxypeptidase family protein
MTDTMWAGLTELSAELADFYRDLHQHPELSLRSTAPPG